MDGMMLAQMGGQPSPFGPILIMAAICGIFYFILIRPQQKKEQDKEVMRANLKKNDEIVTSGGLHGRVVDLKGALIWVEVAPNVRVKMERHAVEAVPSKTAEPAKAAEGHS